MSNNSSNNILALLNGATIGAGIGILLAPDKGAKTRKKIERKAKKTSHDIAEHISYATDEFTSSTKEKKEDFDRKLDEAIISMGKKADTIIATFERKLENIKKKNAQQRK